MFKKEMMAVIIKRIIGRVTAFARAETGQSAVIVALLMTVICGFAALAIDLGYGYYQKNRAACVRRCRITKSGRLFFISSLKSLMTSLMSSERLTVHRLMNMQIN